MKTTAATALALLCAVSAEAQAPDASRPVKSSVEAVAAEVEVLVLDSKGVPVEGLTKNDFKLFVNGKETSPDWFEAPPPAGTPAPASASAAEAPAAAPPPGAAPTRRAHSTVFVLSDLHTNLRARNAGLDALRAYADRLSQGEPAAVYLLDNGVRRLQGFTTDRAALKNALQKSATMLPRSYVFSDVTALSSRPDDIVHGEEWVGQSRQMLRNFSAVLDSLASRPEPKTVVVLTGAVSPTGLIEPIGGDAAGARRAEETGTSYTNVFSTRAIWNFLAEAKDAEAQALLARATIVALDPTGLDSPNAKAEINSMETDLRKMRLSSNYSSLRPADASSEGDRIDTWEFRNDTFAMLAESTGGSRLGFSNKPADLLLDEARRLAKRYRLGFTPPDGTSARRDIRVTVAKPGLVVRTASGQRSQTAESAAAARFAGLLLSADAPKGDFAIAVEMKGPVKKRTDDALPFDVLVPVSGVFAEERGDGKHAKLELMISGVDQEGRASAPMVIPFSVTLDKNAADGTFFRKDSNFNIDSRWKGRLFIGVRDTATNRLGAVAISIGS